MLISRQSKDAVGGFAERWRLEFAYAQLKLSAAIHEELFQERVFGAVCAMSNESAFEEMIIQWNHRSFTAEEAVAF